MPVIAISPGQLTGLHEGNSLPLRNRRPGSEREGWKLHNGTALEGAFVGAEADARPIGGLFRIGEGIAAFDKTHDELVREVRMASAVTGSLGKGEVGFFANAVNSIGCERLSENPLYPILRWVPSIPYPCPNALNQCGVHPSL